MLGYYLKYNHPYLENNYLSCFQFKIGYEFDFMREANAMEKIRRFLYENNKKSVLVPRLMRDIVTRYVLLHFLSQTTMMHLMVFLVKSLHHLIMGAVSSFDF